MPVNREELLAKLAKMGLSKTNMYRMNHGIVAVEEFVASESLDVEIKGCECEQAEVEAPHKGPALSPGSLVLTAEEVAFMVLDFAGGSHV